MIADRTAGSVPASGSVNWYLKMYSAESSKTVPRDYDIVVVPVSSSWQEGLGLDLENYRSPPFLVSLVLLNNH